MDILDAKCRYLMVAEMPGEPSQDEQRTVNSWRTAGGGGPRDKLKNSWSSEPAAFPDDKALLCISTPSPRHL
jgi:hypothetical protein